MRVEHITVVVPAHDEEALLPRCLEGLHTAAQAVSVPVTTVVVLDGCTDGSEAVVRRAGVDVVVLGARNVGAARRAGFESVAPRPHEWFATTDADSRVPAHWLSSHLQHASRGAQLVAGTVAVTDWSGWPDHVRSRYGSAYRSGAAHGHVHGASLGFSADLYRAAGGFAALPAHEDVDLVQRMVERGANVVWSIDAPVETSARVDARAPQGFATYLEGLQDR
ncbi:glycosyltransferase [Rhodococcus sp. NM-2]|jgi:glycosyltransferase involved in cell wall biosynthesis|uniref:glycosyltransferase n=1 Tax=Rhodococcus TaxID=1827 RepID=UPI002475A2F4|nr:glycosyltransferase [Rhodococcus opacus]MDH6290942.1 glycosyltransferase involved in cell wall biosynthesis [Rhodococcus opacus]